MSDSTFNSFAIDENLISAIHKLDWKEPTPVQSSCLPLTLNGKDVAGFAQTGTGKTGVFLITIAHKLLSHSNENAAPEDKGKRKVAPTAVVVTPTRELAIQIHEDAERIFNHLSLSSTVVFGGENWTKQVQKLAKNPQLIVGTTGRLIDLVKRKEIDLTQCKIFVCDEADRMFDMGFIADIEYLYERLTDGVQKLLFSATTNDQVEELAFQYLDEPEYVFLNQDELTPDAIDQELVLCDSSNKLRVMIGLLKDHNPACAIIFTNTKLTAEWLHYKLNNNGFSTELITGNLPQTKRTALIKKIKQGNVNCLIATDVASRGLHISGVTHVYNFDIPNDPSNYIHRIGRTARAGSSGKAISLLCEQYSDLLMPIKNLLGGDLPKASWFDSKYLEIEDKADNPLDRIEVEEPRKEFKREPKVQRPEKGLPSGKRYNKEKPRPKSNGKSPHNKRNNKHGRRDGHDDKNSHKPKKPHKQKNQEFRGSSQAPESGTGMGSMIKRVFKSIFGKR